MPETILPLPPAALDALFADAGARLAQAVRDRRAAMRTPVVVTADGDARMMVLRAADADLAALRFHTDIRSPKLEALAADPRLSVVAYDPQARVQIRLGGDALVQATGALADAAWAATPPISRRCYLAETGPGGVLPAPGAALPVHLRERRPTLAETEPGRAHFAVIVLRAQWLDWLHLSHDGGLRARFTRTDAGWQGAWIAP